MNAVVQIPSTIDTIDGDTFTRLVIAADNGEL